MGLTDLLSRAAASRAHVLLVEAPGAFRTRVALGRAVHAAGWRLTDTVADADVLAVAGEPGPDLTAVLERAWDQLSEPRVRIDVRDEGDIGPALAGARTTLAATDEQRAGARHRHRQQVAGEHGQHDERGQHDGHEEHEGHGDMSPDGIPLAEGAEDRDGLEMDVLHLPLGPVLAHWPPGVVLRLTLHGDVVADAEAARLDPAAGLARADDGPTRAARLLDAAASVLGVAGLPDDAARARRLRDRCLAGATGTSVAGAIEELETRVRRHRLLRWLLKDLVLAGLDGEPAGLHDQLAALLERARAAVAGGSTATDRRVPALDSAARLLVGQELAAVRLWMAAWAGDLTHDVPVEV